jgi:hypothetical protein
MSKKIHSKLFFLMFIVSQTLTASILNSLSEDYINLYYACREYIKKITIDKKTTLGKNDILYHLLYNNSYNGIINFLKMYFQTNQTVKSEELRFLRSLIQNENWIEQTEKDTTQLQLFNQSIIWGGESAIKDLIKNEKFPYKNDSRTTEYFILLAKGFDKISDQLAIDLKNKNHPALDIKNIIEDAQKNNYNKIYQLYEEKLHLQESKIDIEDCQEIIFTNKTLKENRPLSISANKNNIIRIQFPEGSYTPLEIAKMLETFINYIIKYTPQKNNKNIFIEFTSAQSQIYRYIKDNPSFKENNNLNDISHNLFQDITLEEYNIIKNENRTDSKAIEIVDPNTKILTNQNHIKHIIFLYDDTNEYEDVAKTKRIMEFLEFNPDFIKTINNKNINIGFYNLNASTDNGILPICHYQEQGCNIDTVINTYSETPYQVFDENKSKKLLEEVCNEFYSAEKYTRSTTDNAIQKYIEAISYRVKKKLFHSNDFQQGFILSDDMVKEILYDVLVHYFNPEQIKTDKKHEYTNIFIQHFCSRNNPVPVHYISTKDSPMLYMFKHKPPQTYSTLNNFIDNHLKAILYGINLTGINYSTRQQIINDIYANTKKFYQENNIQEITDKIEAIENQLRNPILVKNLSSIKEKELRALQKNLDALDNALIIQNSQYLIEQTHTEWRKNPTTTIVNTINNITSSPLPKQFLDFLGNLTETNAAYDEQHQTLSSCYKKALTKIRQETKHVWEHNQFTVKKNDAFESAIEKIFHPGRENDDGLTSVLISYAELCKCIEEFYPEFTPMPTPLKENINTLENYLSNKSKNRELFKPEDLPKGIGGRHRNIIYFYGTGGLGKSIFIETYSALLGEIFRRYVPTKLSSKFYLLKISAGVNTKFVNSQNEFTKKMTNIMQEAALNGVTLIISLDEHTIRKPTGTNKENDGQYVTPETIKSLSDVAIRCGCHILFASNYPPDNTQEAINRRLLCVEVKQLSPEESYNTLITKIQKINKENNLEIDKLDPHKSLLVLLSQERNNPTPADISNKLVHAYQEWIQKFLTFNKERAQRHNRCHYLTQETVSHMLLKTMLPYVFQTEINNYNNSSNMIRRTLQLMYNINNVEGIAVVNKSQVNPSDTLQNDNKEMINSIASTFEIGKWIMAAWNFLSLNDGKTNFYHNSYGEYIANLSDEHRMYPFQNAGNYSSIKGIYRSLVNWVQLLPSTYKKVVLGDLRMFSTLDTENLYNQRLKNYLEIINYGIVKEFANSKFIKKNDEGIALLHFEAENTEERKVKILMKEITTAATGNKNAEDSHKTLHSNDFACITNFIGWLIKETGILHDRFADRYVKEESNQAHKLLNKTSLFKNRLNIIEQLEKKQHLYRTLIEYHGNKEIGIMDNTLMSTFNYIIAGGAINIINLIKQQLAKNNMKEIYSNNKIVPHTAEALENHKEHIIKRLTRLGIQETITHHLLQGQKIYGYDYANTLTLMLNYVIHEGTQDIDYEKFNIIMELLCERSAKGLAEYGKKNEGDKNIDLAIQTTNFINLHQEFERVEFQNKAESIVYMTQHHPCWKSMSLHEKTDMVATVLAGSKIITNKELETKIATDEHITEEIEKRTIATQSCYQDLHTIIKKHKKNANLIKDTFICKNNNDDIKKDMNLLYLIEMYYIGNGKLYRHEKLTQFFNKLSQKKIDKNAPSLESLFTLEELPANEADMITVKYKEFLDNIENQESSETFKKFITHMREGQINMFNKIHNKNNKKPE